MNVVCFLGVPRTGTNHIFSLMHNIEGLKPRYEVFHNKEAFSLNNDDIAALSAKAGQEFTGRTDPALIAWMKAYPRAAMRTIRPKTGVLVFKLFPSHLPPAAFKLKLANWDEIGFISIRRRAIDSYISEKKAMSISSFARADTTHIKIELKADDFLNYFRVRRRWYKQVEAEVEAAGRKLVKLSYEELIKPSDAETTAEILKAIQSVGIDTPLRIAKAGKGLVKQDQSESYEDRVTNWPEFLEAVKRKDPKFDVFARP